MKGERAALLVVVVAQLAGCGVLNGLTEGEVRSPFQQDTSQDGEGEGEGEDPGEGEGEGPNDVVFEARTTSNGVPFSVAIPDGYGESRYAVIVVAAADPCLQDLYTSPLYAADMAIVHVPAANLTSARLTDVFDTLESSIGLDDSKTFAVVAGPASRVIEETRVGNASSPGLVLLSPALPGAGAPPDPELRSRHTTIFATVADPAATAISTATGWPVVRIDGTDEGCGLLTHTNAATGQIAGEQLRDLLLARDG